MRRLVAISNKTSKATIAIVCLTIALTSIHLAASARMESLRRQQDQIEHTLNGQRVSNAGKQPNVVRGISAQNHQAVSRQQPADSAQNQTAATIALHTRQIVVSIPDRQLAVLESGEVIRIYPIAVGTNTTPSPDGDFVIVNRAKDPTYRHGDVEIAPGKDNPLGSRWMGLNLKGYGIHGTNVQSSIGKASSHGCFRMRKRDVEELYSLMQVGDTVTVRRERDATIAQVFAAPATTPAANVLAARTIGTSEVQIASATEKTTVETTQQ
jgi:lipoprotein-anchoring transpeptidase ErfK/SrfK